VGQGPHALEAFIRAQAGDPVSAFGGIVAFNRPVGAEVARVMAQNFWEVILAPAFTGEALEVFAAKKQLGLGYKVAPLEGLYWRDGDDLDFDPLDRYPYRGWELLYRKQFSWDKVVRSTHSANCTGSCSWMVYVKDGVMIREEQASDYPRINADLPDYNPRIKEIDGRLLPLGIFKLLSRRRSFRRLRRCGRATSSRTARTRSRSNGRGPSPTTDMSTAPAGLRAQESSDTNRIRG